jgi:hypothetical protein
VTINSGHGKGLELCPEDKFLEGLLVIRRREARRWQTRCSVYAARFHAYDYGPAEGIRDD